MRILIADKFGQTGIDGLQELGFEVEYEPQLVPETLPGAISGVDILMVRSTKVPSSVISESDCLKGIIRAGAGYDNIDIEAATERGIHVCNCPGMNAIAVAELAMGLLLCCDRRIADQTADLKAGHWRKKEYAKARGLKGMTLGVAGVGAVGMALIRRARAFQMSVCAWSKYMTVDQAAELGAIYGGQDREALLAMLETCDAVSVHVSATDETRDLCDDEFFSAMKDGAYFINTSRGSVVDEAALVRAIETKGIRCGLDVYRDQPPTPEAEWRPGIVDQAGVTLTHHVGASTDQAQEAVSDEVIRIVRIFKETGHFNNCVNEAELGAAQSSA